jgi:hypothetical protein
MLPAARDEWLTYYQGWKNVDIELFMELTINEEWMIDG